MLTNTDDSPLPAATSKLLVGFSMKYSIKSESQFCAKLLLVLNQPLRGMTHPLLSTPPVVENSCPISGCELDLRTDWLPFFFSTAFAAS